jgi:hypothetical protein
MKIAMKHLTMDCLFGEIASAHSLPAGRQGNGLRNDGLDEASCGLFYGPCKCRITQWPDIE